MDLMLYSAFPEDVQRKVGFCFRERCGMYYAFPNGDHQIKSGSGYGTYVNARSFRALVDLVRCKIVPVAMASSEF